MYLSPINNVNNSQKQSFESRYLIKELPLEIKKIRSAKLGMGFKEFAYEYYTKEEAAANKRTNDVIKKFIELAQKKLGKEIKIQKRPNMERLTFEYAIDIINVGFDKTFERLFKKIAVQSKLGRKINPRPEIKYQKETMI